LVKPFRVFVNFKNEEEDDDKPKIPVAKAKKMFDKTEMPLDKRTLSQTPSLEACDDASEYETPVYPPLRHIDSNLKPKKPTIVMGSKKKKTTAKIAFEQEPTYFDCVRTGELDMVKHFVKDLKLNPNASTYLGISVLHMSVESGNLQVITLLVDSGAKVNVVDADGWSPFHLGCSIGNIDVVKYLIEKGSDINAPTKEGEYAIEIAESDEIKNYIKNSKGFDQSILETIANRPKVEDESGDNKNKKLRKKNSSDY